MGELRLSQSQRAYRSDREQFLQRLEAAAERLFADGYRAAKTDCPYAFVLTCPHKDGENTYFVDALRETCTCPFYTRQVEGELLEEDGGFLTCKHLRGLKSLVKQTRLAHFTEGETACGYRLWTHWIAVLSERRRLERRSPTCERALWIPSGQRASMTLDEI